jgi:Cu/Ag efflux protein CusF
LSSGEIMPRRVVFCLTVCLLAAATAAQAQMGGGGGGRGHRGGGSPSTSGGGATPASPSLPLPREKPANEIEIVGVVRAIAPETDRITIAYEAVDALNWPAGTMPFPVAKSALLKDVTVGEKVRFRLDSEQIAELKPF